MQFYHIPVMPVESLDYLQIQRGSCCCDLTCGGGGHTRLMAEAMEGQGTLVAIDQDPNALEHARKVLADTAVDVRWVRGNFRNLNSILDEQRIDLLDAALIDCGVSSAQLDRPELGFSVMSDGPLLMAMDPDAALNAEEVVNEWSEEDLSRGMFEATGDRYTRSIVRRIVRARSEKRIVTTAQLAGVIESALPRSVRASERHPAIVAFLGIRSLVNDEGNALDQGIMAAISRLRRGGRLVCICFHSTELARVRKRLQWAAGRCQCPPGTLDCHCGTKPLVTLLTRKPVAPGMQELSQNPRARSARLLAVERTELSAIAQ